MTLPRALIVDDEPDIRELLEITLNRMEIETVLVGNVERARAALTQGKFDLCLTDMRLPDASGIDLVRFIQQQFPSIPVAMITAHGSMETAVEALKAGAFDFVSKPVDLQSLRNLVTTALKLSQSAAPQGRSLVGTSPAMDTLRDKISKLARSQAPIYISGESGTGKELVARMIHEQGPRAASAFVPVNCGAIPQELMESELFGHKKGSFTGAVSDKLGLFQSAEQGTLFLDEVAELPVHMQVKLLRAIQEKSVRPVGAEREVPVDVRILSATHQDLAELVERGTFRQDLFYRVNVIQLQVPPLRKRPGDIPLLADHILHRLAGQMGVEIPEISPASLAVLKAYKFPGNVRELENVLERAMTLCEGSTIEEVNLGLSAPNPADDAEFGVNSDDLNTLLVSVEKEKILRALEETRWNKTAAAKFLGISFGALRYRMQKLGLE